MAKFNPTETMKGEIVEYLKSLRYHPLSSTIREVRSNDKIHKESLYSTTPISKKDSFITTMLSLSSPEVDRVAGALVGLAVADSLGNFSRIASILIILIYSTPVQGTILNLNLSEILLLLIKVLFTHHLPVTIHVVK
jgi:hypothetical protein